MSNTQTQPYQEQAARNRVEQDIAKLALIGGSAAIERQVNLLSRFRAQVEGKPGLVDFADMIDWGLECCYRQHPVFTKAIDKFVASMA